MTKEGKIKVLQFPIANTKGGITQYVLRNWQFIDKSKFHFDFATMSKELDFEENLKKEGCKIFYISVYAEEDELKFKEEFEMIIKEGNYDIVHLHTESWKSIFVEEIARKYGVKKIIIHAHNTGISESNKQKEMIELHKIGLENLNESIATDFWACSKAAANFLYGNKIKKEKVIIMNNAIELQKFSYNEQIRNRYRKKLGIKNEEIVIGTVGRIAWEKNQEFLLRVFLKLNNIKTNFKLLIVGTGELESRLKKFVMKNNLEDKVLFLGFRQDIENLLQVFDIFCLPSRFEGFPIALVEAHTSGVKCIVSDTITEEVKLSELVSRIPLNEEVWINEILNYKKCNRFIYEEITRKLGYDIEKQIIKVQKEYIVGMENDTVL